MRNIMQPFEDVNTDVLRLILAVCLSGGAGFWGLIILFSDNAYTDRVYFTYIFAAHFLPSIVVGLLVPSRWYVSVLTSWGALLMGGLFLIGYLRHLLGDPNTQPCAGCTLLVLLPVIGALLGGYAGSKIASVWGRGSAT